MALSAPFEIRWAAIRFRQPAPESSGGLSPHGNRAHLSWQKVRRDSLRPRPIARGHATPLDPWATAPNVATDHMQPKRCAGRSRNGTKRTLRLSSEPTVFDPTLGNGYMSTCDPVRTLHCEDEAVLWISHEPLRMYYDRVIDLARNSMQRYVNVIGIFDEICGRRTFLTATRT